MDHELGDAPLLALVEAILITRIIAFPDIVLAPAGPDAVNGRLIRAAVCCADAVGD